MLCKVIIISATGLITGFFLPLKRKFSFSSVMLFENRGLLELERWKQKATSCLKIHPSPTVLWLKVLTGKKRIRCMQIRTTMKKFMSPLTIKPIFCSETAGHLYLNQSISAEQTWSISAYILTANVLRRLLRTRWHVNSVKKVHNTWDGSWDDVTHYHRTEFLVRVRRSV